MGVQLPSEPITRKEQYLAKAAGQAVEIPAEPITREEAYLDAIAKGSGGGGGGTSDYPQLTNKPQINGNTLVGNKTASQLGLVAAETGKGLSSNDFTDADKAIVGGVTAALADKQDVLTVGDYISIDAHNNISVNRDLVPHQTSYRIKGTGRDTMNITKYIDGVQESSTDYVYSQGTTRTIDDAFTINDTYSSDGYIWQFVWLKDSTTHDKDYTVAYRSYEGAFDFTEVFNDEDLSGYKLVIKSEMDTALATKADITDLAPAFSTATAYTVGQYVSYDGNIYKCTSAHSAGAWAAGDFTLVAVGSELESKQNATDNSLQTTDKTVVGAINEHEGDVDSLKSGLTNVDVALSVPENTGKNVLPMTLDNLKSLNTRGTWSGNAYTYLGVTFTVQTDSNGSVTSIVANGTASNKIWFRLVPTTFDIMNGTILSGITNGSQNSFSMYALESNDTTVIVQLTNGEYTFTDNYENVNMYINILSGVAVDNITFYPMLRPAGTTSAFAPYIPSVESRIEAVESGLTNLNDLIVYVSDNYSFGNVAVGETKRERITLPNKTGYNLASANGHLNYADSAIVSCQITDNTTLDVYVTNTKSFTLENQTLYYRLIYVKTSA